jgi:L,D-peptidoglycan transpeptidase YkuD (ErfK/YbiS/YcfS/YnhG family)
MECRRHGFIGCAGRSARKRTGVPAEPTGVTGQLVVGHLAVATCSVPERRDVLWVMTLV